MISLDYSIIPAILIFLSLVIALNYLLFKPLLKVQAERERRTTGQLEEARKRHEHHADMFDRYQLAIRNGRLEGYRMQEQVRAEAAKKRSERLDTSRRLAEAMLVESRASLQAQVLAAKEQLEGEAREIARGIAQNVLQRSA